MNETNSVRVITLKDLWNLFTQRFLVIVLAAAVTAGGAFAVNMVTFDPQYASTATMYILRQGGGENTSSGEAANELTLALRLVYDCNYFLKSRTVLNTVIEDLELDMTYDQLYSMVHTSNPTNTRILEITATADSPELAKAIVDRICDIGPGRIENAMGFSQVNLYEYGTLTIDPVNEPSILVYGVLGLAAALVTYAVFLLMFILDDRMRTDEDIESILGLSVLAEIPNTGSGGKKAYGYYHSRNHLRHTEKSTSNSAEKGS